MNTRFSLQILGLFLILFPFTSIAQIQVFESEKSDTTQYARPDSISQDTVFIVYKGENNKSTITLFANLNGIDSLNFDWYRYNKDLKDFELFRSIDTVKTDTIFYGTIPGENMNDYEGGYRVYIHNQQKGIDTTFTIWLWYQDFFINSVGVYLSTCEDLVLEADTSFHDVFTYYDLSVDTLPALSLLNGARLLWTIDPGEESKEGVRPRFLAPVEPTTYTVYGIDSYGFVRERTINIDETKFDNKGYPYLRAVKSEFSGIHGLPSDNNKPSKDTAVQVEAPHGVWFYNESKNAEEYEWIFYNHKDWRTSDGDTTLYTSTFFEPIDSIYYERPPRDTLISPAGYDVKLTVKGPIYNSNNETCIDTIRKVNFVLVTPTKFPKQPDGKKNSPEMPNVFTPNASTNNYFYFLENNLPKSIQYFSVKIYNRWGNKVYEYEDNDGSWQERGESKPGWNGTTRVGTKAKPGVYYYTILATGWDGKEFKVGGFVHIFY